MIKIAIIGCGAVAEQFYAPALLAIAKEGICDLIACGDPAKERTEAIRKVFPKAKGYQQCDAAMLHGAQLAIIASPPRFHHQQMMMALGAGVDVLCEKPFVNDEAEGLEACQLAEEKKLVLAAGHYKRFMPAHVVLKSLIEQRTFGDLLDLRVAVGGKFGWAAVSDSFFRKEITPGGVFLDIGCHVMDLILWWLGEPTEFTYSDDARDGLEANCVFEGVFPLRTSPTQGSAKVRVRLSRDWKTENCSVFRFERAVIHCRENASNQLELTLDGIPVTFAAELRDPIPPRPWSPTQVLETNAQSFIKQLLDVCDAVEKRRSPMVTGRDGTNVIRFIRSCYAIKQRMPEPWNDPLPAVEPAS